MPASTTKSTRSTSASAPVTVRLSARFSALPWRVWKPGVSTNTNCASATVRTPVMRWRVVCAFLLVMETFCPTSALSNVDLPTLGRPTMAMRPQRCGRSVSCMAVSRLGLPDLRQQGGGRLLLGGAA